MKTNFKFLFIILCLLPKILSFAETEKTPKSVVHVEISDMVDLGLAPFIERIIKDAEEQKADAIIFEINTFGGRLDAAVKIRDAILNTKILTVAFINKRAISAGALISLSCNKIAMAEGSTIGAATPVMVTPTQETKDTSEKVVSYFRSEMRATAEKTKRNPKIAEAMVDPDIEIKDITEKGKLLTLTTDGALQNKMCDFKAESIEDVLAKLVLTGAKIVNKKTNWAERFVRFITNPVVSSLLLTIGFLAIYLEFKTGGFGLAAIVAIVALSLFFFGQYTVKLAGVEELILFAIGFILLMAEIFFIPGFGLAGVLGAAFILLSIVLSLIDTTIPVTLTGLSLAFIRLGASMLITIFIIIVLVRYLPATQFGKRIVLAEGLLGGGGYAEKVENSVDSENILHMKGKTITGLHPAGKAQIGTKKIDVLSEGGYIEEGETIQVIKIEGSRIVVKKVKEDESV